MDSEFAARAEHVRTNPFTADDVAAILTERGWLRERTDAVNQWLADAAAWLGPYATDRAALTALLALVFHYDAGEVLSFQTSHALLAHEGTRDVLRALALEILSGGPVDSPRLKEIITALREKHSYRSRGIFYPLRMAIAGRTGQGELERVILLLDRAATLEGFAPVKSVRERILEFCTALD